MKKEPSKVYIIGRITDALSVSTQNKFAHAQKKLERLNIEVFNPIDSFLKYPASKEQAIKDNVNSLLNANAVYVLHDSCLVKENQIELLLATKLNKLIMHEF